MMRWFEPVSLFALMALIVACGTSSKTSQVSHSIAPGTLAVNPPFRIASLDAAAFGTELAASTAEAELLALTGTPPNYTAFYDRDSNAQGNAANGGPAAFPDVVPRAGGHGRRGLYRVGPWASNSDRKPGWSPPVIRSNRRLCCCGAYCREGELRPPHRVQ